MNAHLKPETLAPANAPSLGTNAEWHARRLAATPRGVAVMGDFFIDHAKNAELWDIEGRRFIDFVGGIAVLNTGHRHPKIEAAIAEQLQRFTHSCYQVVPYAQYVSLAERINAIVPIDGPTKTALFSTGAEAVENAVKIARSYTGRSGVIAFGGAFHGRSMFAVSLTGKVQPYKAGFGPFPPELYHVPFPCHCANLDEVKKAVYQLFKADIEPSRVAAIVFEPVQGEGGFNVIQPAAVQWLRELCNEHGIVMIADEVQTGFGRTGTLFACEQANITPDFLVLSKGLTAGYLPMSVVMTTEEIYAIFYDRYDTLKGFLHSHSYTGNALAARVALASLDLFARDDVIAQNRERSRVMAEALTPLRDHPQVLEVRQTGMVAAIELVRDKATRTPYDWRERRGLAIFQAALKRGLLLRPIGNVVYFMPPYIITPEQIRWMVATAAEAIDEGLRAPAGHFSERGPSMA